MARSVDPRSRRSASRAAGVSEAWLRKMETTGALPPVHQWSAVELVWARTLACAGVDVAHLPPKPDTIADSDVLVVPLEGQETGAVHHSPMEAMVAVDKFGTTPVAVLSIGKWHQQLREVWD